MDLIFEKIPKMKPFPKLLGDSPLRPIYGDTECIIYEGSLPPIHTPSAISRCSNCGKPYLRGVYFTGKTHINEWRQDCKCRFDRLKGWTLGTNL